MTRLIDADALIAEIDGMIKNAQNMGSKFDLAVSYGLIGANGVIKDAPTIEPSGDLISRADAIRVCHDSTVANGYDIADKINALPSADMTEIETCQRCQESVDTILNRQGERIKALEESADRLAGEWIPCNERLPELPEIYEKFRMSDEVLGTDIHGQLRHVYLTTEYGNYNMRFQTVEEGMGVEIVAWMPLPEPYREEATE